MYAMACGHPPFRADTPYAVLKRIVEQPHRPISHIRADAPRYLIEILDRLLEKDPRRRFPSATALAEHLEDCLAHIRQPTLTDLPRLSKPVSRWSTQAILGGAIFAAAASLLAVWLVVGLVGLLPSSLKGPASVGAAPVDSETGDHASVDLASGSSVASDPAVMPGDRWLDEPELSSLEAELDMISKSFEQTFVPEK